MYQSQNQRTSLLKPQKAALSSSKRTGVVQYLFNKMPNLVFSPLGTLGRAAMTTGTSKRVLLYEVGDKSLKGGGGGEGGRGGAVAIDQYKL